MFVDVFASLKADVNVKLNGSTLLHQAVKKNSLDITKLLLTATEGNTPYDYAEGEVKELLKKYGGAGSESWRLWRYQLKAKLKKKLKIGFK